MSLQNSMSCNFAKCTDKKRCTDSSKNEKHHTHTHILDYQPITNSSNKGLCFSALSPTRDNSNKLQNQIDFPIQFTRGIKVRRTYQCKQLSHKESSNSFFPATVDLKYSCKISTVYLGSNTIDPRLVCVAKEKGTRQKYKVHRNNLFNPTGNKVPKHCCSTQQTNPVRFR